MDRFEYFLYLNHKHGWRKFSLVFVRIVQRRTKWFNDDNINAIIEGKSLGNCSKAGGLTGPKMKAFGLDLNSRKNLACNIAVGLVLGDSISCPDKSTFQCPNFYL